MFKNFKFQTYFWTTFWVISGVVLGFIFIVIFNGCDEKINIGSALIWAGAYFVLGALGGFIFGVPKIVSASQPPTVGSMVTRVPAAPVLAENLPAQPGNSPDVQVPPAPLIPVVPVTSVMKNISQKMIQENTNLTQISDWLTKVIIGAGLVQLKEIPPYIMKIATRMGRGISLHPKTLQSADPAIILSGGIIIYFLTWGFASGYLIMRLVIAELLADVEQ